MHHRLPVIGLVVILTACGSSPAVSQNPAASLATAASTPIVVTTPAAVSPQTVAPTGPADPTLTTMLTTTSNLLTPGQKIGDMVITTSEVGSRALGDWCPSNPYFQPGEKVAHPTTTTITCSKPVPLVSNLLMGDGWLATTAELRDSNWQAMTWDLYIDGHQVDLPKFGTTDYTNEAGPGPGRGWNVHLEHLTPGAHTMRSVLRVSQSIFDGVTTYPAGTYDTTYKLTVSTSAQ